MITYVVVDRKTQKSIGKFIEDEAFDFDVRHYELMSQSQFHAYKGCLPIALINVWSGRKKILYPVFSLSDLADLFMSSGGFVLKSSLTKKQKLYIDYREECISLSPNDNCFLNLNIKGIE